MSGKRVKLSMEIGEVDHEVTFTATPGAKGGGVCPDDPPEIEVISIVDIDGNDCTDTVEKSKEFEVAMASWATDKILDMLMDDERDAEERDADHYWETRHDRRMFN